MPLKLRPPQPQPLSSGLASSSALARGAVGAPTVVLAGVVLGNLWQHGSWSGDRERNGVHLQGRV
jgi:hypothetical protein